MEKLDLYKVLEVSKEASQDEIRRSYRRLARKYHPDANPGRQGRRKTVSKRYSTPTRSSRNPRREGNTTKVPAPSSAPGELDSRAAQISKTSRICSAASGTSGISSDVRPVPRRRAQAKGENITVNVRLSFKDALNGVTTRVGVPVEEACGECRGTGAAPGTAPRTCPDCGGRGVQSRDQGFFALSTPCSRCGGEGRIIEKPCSVCGGNGRVRRSRQVKVRIPAGARDKMKVRIPGRGNAGRKGGPAGDLYVVTRVEEHPVFKRRGDDFVVGVPVSFVEAALGAQIEVPRPGGGTVRVKLPAGTQDGKQFKVRGAGAPRAKTNGGEKGDLIVRVSVVVPKKLKRREREILEALAEERDEDVREDLFKKVGSS